MMELGGRQDLAAADRELKCGRHTKNFRQKRERKPLSRLPGCGFDRRTAARPGKVLRGGHHSILFHWLESSGLATTPCKEGGVILHRWQYAGLGLKPREQRYQGTEHKPTPRSTLQGEDF